jgi:hypothetical protein
MPSLRRWLQQVTIYVLAFITYMSKCYCISQEVIYSLRVKLKVSCSYLKKSSASIGFVYPMTERR